jgi:hypothetical protein
MRRTRKLKIPELLFVFLVLTIILQSACNVREPGCLDIEAENFDFAAERHDQTLCVYPNLILNVLYQWTDSSLQTGYLYRNAAGMDYAIHGVQVLLSGFRLQDDSGIDLTIDESLTFTLGECSSGNVLEVLDDFLFADRSSFNYVVGAFRSSGPMTQVSMTVGVPDSYTPLCITSLPANHLLRGQRAGYDEAKGDFALGRFIISRDSVEAIRDTIFAYGTPQLLNFDLSRSFRQGRPDTLYMSVDFHQIFDPVDLSQEKALIAAALASRIGQAIKLQ